MNDSEENIESIAQFLGELKVTTAFISAPIDRRLKMGHLSRRKFFSAYQIYTRNNKIPKVELLINYEGNDFTIGEKVVEDFLAIISVHPMREDAVRDFLRKAHLNWEFIDDLLANKKIKRLSYQSYQYFMRKNVNREE